METITTFHKGEDAYLFRAFLESQGIRAHVFDEYVLQMQWLYTAAIGGVRVVVDAEDLERAAELLKAYEETVTASPQVVGEVKVWPAALLVSFIIGVPFFLLGRKIPEAWRPKA